MVRIAILASGNGTNADALMDHFKGHAHGEVVLVGCDRPRAPVVRRAWDHGVPSYLFSGEDLRNGAVLHELRGQAIQVVVLAGFLRLIPKEMVHAFPERIVNVHPALLPKYGGRGMYGERVHRAVLEAGERESGITIHLVNERYDEGEHLLQVKCPVLDGDTPGSLATRIHELEHRCYPIAVERLCRQLDNAEAVNN